jgi:hypothetical protein
MGGGLNVCPRLRRIRLFTSRRYSAYGTVNFPSLPGVITAGQETRRLSADAEGRNDLCRVLKKDRASAIHPVPTGTVRAEHHPRPASASHGQAEVLAGGYFRPLIWTYRQGFYRILACKVHGQNEEYESVGLKLKREYPKSHVLLRSLGYRESFSSNRTVGSFFSR